jgi:ABC-type uncharacterized transport system permease subunit
MLVCACLEVAFVAIRRTWPLSIAVISGIFYSAPTWVALLLLSAFFQRSEYLVPLVVAVVVSAVTGSVMLAAGNRLKDWIVGDKTDLSRIEHASCRFPFSTMMAIVLTIGFWLPVAQFRSEVRASAVAQQPADLVPARLPRSRASRSGQSQ